MYGRTSFFSLIMYAQLLMIIVGYEMMLFTSYLYYQETVIAKILSYSFIGISFLSSAIHLGYCFSILQRQIHNLIPLEGIFRCLVTSILFFCGIILYPFIICLFPKSLWFFFFSNIGIFLQIYHSATN